MANGEFGNEARRAALSERGPQGLPSSEGPAPQRGGNPLLDIVEILEAVAPSLPPESQQLVTQAAGLLQQAAEARPQGGPGNAPKAGPEGAPAPL